MIRKAALLLSLVATLPADAGVIPERVETALRERIAAGELPAAVVAMIEDGQVAIEGFGTLPGGGPPDGDTLFEIGSVTKTFTATLLAEAVVRGEVRLDEPVRDLLPGFAIPSRDGREITLADIAEQHSGLPRMPDNFRPRDTADPFADYDAGRLKQFLAGYTLPRDPGAAYEYSNLAIGLLGYALAENRHVSYDDLLAERIFRPLGMTSSAVSLAPFLRTRLAPGEDAAAKSAPHWHLDALAGAGGISSSAADMLRYVRAYMGKVPTPLHAAMSLAITPRRPVDDQQIGLVWMRLPIPGGGTVVWHNGLTGGYASFIGFTADSRKGVVILTNRAQEIDDLGFAALGDPRPLAAAHKTVALSAAQLAPLAGTYKLREKTFLTLTAANGMLVAGVTGHPSFELYPASETEFFTQIGDVSLTFIRDGTAAATGLVLHREGDHPAPRVADQAAATELGAVPLDPDALAAYQGRYALTPTVAFEIHPDGERLRAQLLGQPPAALFASAPDHFFYLATDAQIDFQRDAKGAVSGLTLRQDGRVLAAPRLP
jgi:CubicO group peptidase (beta-lactamase class C family)